MVGVRQVDGGTALLPHLLQKVEPVVEVEVGVVGGAEVNRLERLVRKRSGSRRVAEGEEVGPGPDLPADPPLRADAAG